MLSRYCDCVERASIDEAFLDVTSLVMDRMKLLQQTRPEGFPLITSSMLPATHVAGYSATMETDSKGLLVYMYTYYCLYYSILHKKVCEMVTSIRDTFVWRFTVDIFMKH